MNRLICACVCLIVAGTCMAAEVVSLPAGVDLIPGAFAASRQPDGNSVILRAPDGLVVIDTGRHAEHTQKIIDHAKAANLPIKAVINSHWHLDHVGGNTLIREAYPSVKIYASGAIDGAMHGFLADYRKQLEGAIAQSRDAAQILSWRGEIAIIDAGPALYPDVRIDKTQTRRVAGRNLTLHLEKHTVTAGDVWVLDAQTRVLVAGDLVTLPVPFLDTACPAHWKSALDELARANFSTLVPGHGEPMSRAQFETYRDAYANLFVCSLSEKNKSVCIDGWLADAKSLLQGSDPAFVKSLLDYYIDNSLRASKGKLEKLCGGAAS